MRLCSWIKSLVLEALTNLTSFSVIYLLRTAKFSTSITSYHCFHSFVTFPMQSIQSLRNPRVVLTASYCWEQHNSNLTPWSLMYSVRSLQKRISRIFPSTKSPTLSIFALQTNRLSPCWNIWATLSNSPKSQIRSSYTWLSDRSTWITNLF